MQVLHAGAHTKHNQEETVSERQLDVLLVIPGDNEEVYQGFRRQHHTEPPAFARFIAAYLMRRGLGVDLIDAGIRELTDAERAAGLAVPELVAREIVARKPRVVWTAVYGYEPSVSTQTMPSARRIAQAVRALDPTIPIIFSGDHPASLPERTLREEPIDFVSSGEGPITAHELVQALKAGTGFERVRSLWWRRDGEIVRNAPAPLVDLNAEPALAGWQIMNPQAYTSDIWPNYWQKEYGERRGYANPFSTMGCPFHCYFCNVQPTFRDGETADPKRSLTRKDGLPVNSYRLLDPRLFVEEVAYLVERHGVRNFKIPDPMFDLNKRHVIAIGRGLAERLGEDAITIWAYARFDTVDSEMLEAGRRGGIKHLCVAVEAGDPVLRGNLDKKFGDKEIFRVAKLFKQAGVEMACNFIFGVKGETRETMRRTYDLACALNTHFANFYCTKALPGSTLYPEAQALGYPLPERAGGPGWIGYSQYGSDAEPYYPGAALTPFEIVRFRDWAHVAYYTRPEYLAMMRANPLYGERAITMVGTWLQGIRELKRKPAEEFPVWKPAGA